MADYFLLKQVCGKNNISYLENEPLKAHTTFKIGGATPMFIQPSDENQIIDVIACCRDNNIPYFFMGNGSNVLVDSQGTEKVIIALDKNFSDISLIGDTEIEVKAGASLSSVCKFALMHSLSGLEFAYGIPGNIGGAVYMNAGAYGGEIKDVFKSCEAISDKGVKKTFENSECDFSYRHSIFEDSEYCITSAIFTLKKSEKTEITDKMNELLSKRKDKQPINLPSAGSTFKRPVGAYAAELIDRCGLSGLSVGDAQVSEKHCGFIVNKGNATSEDVLSLIEKVSKTVLEKTGYHIEPEVRILK